MRKSVVFLSLFVLAALAFSACVPSTPAPLGGSTSTPAVGAGLMTETPIVGAPGLATETPVVGAPGLETATPVVPLVMTETPVAQTGQTGAQFVQFSNLLNQDVMSSDGNPLGTVAGVIITNPQVSASAAQSAVGSALATATPNASNAGNAANQLAQAYTPPQLIYVEVKPTTAAANESVLVPYHAIDFTSPDTNALKLTIDAQAFQGAPLNTGDPFASGPGVAWDKSLSDYWSGMGVQVPVTGSLNTAESSVFMLQNLSNLNLTVNNQTAASISDFLFDPATGEMRYAVITGGQMFGNRQVVVPMSALSLQAAASQNGVGAGLAGLTSNIPLELFNAAPIFDALNGLNLAGSQTIDQYWNQFLNSQNQTNP